MIASLVILGITVRRLLEDNPLVAAGEVTIAMAGQEIPDNTMQNQVCYQWHVYQCTLLTFCVSWHDLVKAINVHSSVIHPHLFLPGYYAPNCSVAQVECPLGTYNPLPEQSECFECEPGFYCPEKAMTNRTACPAGYYCGNGTYVPSACPPGTYSNLWVLCFFWPITLTSELQW